jgi:hypothetical protein
MSDSDRWAAIEKSEFEKYTRHAAGGLARAAHAHRGSDGTSYKNPSQYVVGGKTQ